MFIQQMFTEPLDYVPGLIAGIGDINDSPFDNLMKAMDLLFSRMRAKKKTNIFKII